MAANPREKVWAAVYQLISGASFPFTLVNLGQGRDMKTWDEVNSAQQPALYIQQGMEKPDQESNGPLLGLNRWYWLGDIWVYYRRDNQTLPSTVYNKVTDAIDSVILPRPGVKQTLAAQNGGVPLIINMRMTDVVHSEGILDPKGGQCIVKVGIEILIGS